MVRHTHPVTTACKFAAALVLAAFAGALSTESAAQNRPGWSALHYGTFSGSDGIVKLVLERGADKDARAPNGYSPLMLAVRNGNLAAAKTLLYADADVSVEGPRGETAMKLSAARGERGDGGIAEAGGGVAVRPGAKQGNSP